MAMLKNRKLSQEEKQQKQEAKRILREQKIKAAISMGYLVISTKAPKKQTKKESTPMITYNNTDLLMLNKKMPENQRNHS